ncbi:peptidoglycan-binding protein [Streptomyces sp. NPDC057950]|uniref:peptidoglycan-binding domain-containing protein n=1 Tax=Streptomyces sp. NPDC057950 TaxID=3346288 RepID=UPI0036E0E9AC
MRTSRLPRSLAVGLAAAAVAGGALFAAPAASASQLPNIAEGYDNNPHAVWCVQHLINDWVIHEHVSGNITRPMDEDGVFGNETASWVKKAQVWWMGLPGDGIVGPHTGQHLIHDTSLTGDNYYGGSGHYCDGFIPTDW